MADFATSEQIISEKVLDCISGLTARYEAGMIDEMALRIGVEAIWACLGGVIETSLFGVITQEANAYLSGLPQSVMTRIYQKGDSVVILERRDEMVHATTAVFGGHTIRRTASADVAADFVKKLHENPDNAWND